MSMCTSISLVPRLCPAYSYVGDFTLYPNKIYVAYNVEQQITSQLCRYWQILVSRKI